MKAIAASDKIATQLFVSSAIAIADGWRRQFKVVQGDAFNFEKYLTFRCQSRIR